MKKKFQQTERFKNFYTFLLDNKKRIDRSCFKTILTTPDFSQINTLNFLSLKKLQEDHSLSVVTLLFSVSNLGFLAFLKKKGFCSHSEKSVSKTFWHKDVWQLHVEGKKKKKRNEFAEKRKSSQNLIY